MRLGIAEPINGPKKGITFVTPTITLTRVIGHVKDTEHDEGEHAYNKRVNQLANDKPAERAVGHAQLIEQPVDSLAVEQRKSSLFA